MEESTIYTIIIVAGVVNLAILFVLVHFAVKTATKSLREDLTFLTELKALEMQKKGYGEDIQNIIFKKEQLRALEKQRSDGYINSVQFEEKKKQLLVKN